MKPQICTWCGEHIERDDPIDQLRILPEHRECGFRRIMGSLAHIEGRCSCADPQSHDTDPPHVTKRIAAKLAYEAWKKQNYTFPRE